MSQILQLFIWLPLVTFFLSLMVNKRKEKIISGIAITSASLYVAGSIAFILYWAFNGAPVLDIKHIVLYKSTSFEFFIDFYFDLTTAVYAVVGGIITLLVSIFSRFYLHREEGFKRFFNTLLLFLLGYNLVIFSGNLETLFMGWEVLGICSFLLIAFYRDRYLPVKNGLKVISLYRFGDVCLILAMWMSHHLFHTNITFNGLADGTFNAHLLSENYGSLIFISIMLIIAAAVKSAQLPFSSWLPRAMEGPTTSSAIFYGSLSVHLGAFLLIRTYPLWENVLAIKISIIAIGALTSIVAASIAQVQSTVKTQIAYSSITQMGLIFIEVALGFHVLALIHFAGNAFLRTYQLLVSPSVLNYQIHDMFFNFKKGEAKTEQPFQKLRNAFYMLGIKEWNLDGFMYRLMWNPFKAIGKGINLILGKLSLLLLSGILLFSLLGFIAKDQVPAHIDDYVSFASALLGLLLILASLAERGDARRAWLLVLAGQGFVLLGVAFNEFVPLHQLMYFLSGVSIAAVAGYVCLDKIKSIDEDIQLNKFHGYAYERPLAAFIFLLCCLAMAGFPFTATFLGIDLLFTHLHPHQYLLTAVVSLSFVFIEIAILRLYARIFLGQHKKNDHPIAFRSS